MEQRVPRHSGGRVAVSVMPLARPVTVFCSPGRQGMVSGQRGADGARLQLRLSESVRSCVLHGAGRTGTNGTALEEEDEGDEDDDNRDAGDREHCPLEGNVRVAVVASKHLSDLESQHGVREGFLLNFPELLGGFLLLTQSGTEAPTQDLINVFAATADAAKSAYESTM